MYAQLMVNLHSNTKHNYEVLFVVYTNGWILDEFATIIEHGWQVYLQSPWSFLPVTFTFLYGLYTAVRIDDFIWGSASDKLAMDLVITAAPVLLARMAFSAMSYSIVFMQSCETSQYC
jgi:hypothetical protein